MPGRGGAARGGRELGLSSPGPAARDALECRVLSAAPCGSCWARVRAGAGAQCAVRWVSCHSERTHQACGVWVGRDIGPGRSQALSLRIQLRMSEDPKSVCAGSLQCSLWALLGMRPGH